MDNFLLRNVSSKLFTEVWTRIYKKSFFVCAGHSMVKIATVFLAGHQWHHGKCNHWLEVCVSLTSPCFWSVLQVFYKWVTAVHEGNTCMESTPLCTKGITPNKNFLLIFDFHWQIWTKNTLHRMLFNIANIIKSQHNKSTDRTKI